MAQQYRVVISGRTISGAPLADLKTAVGRAFRLEGEALERLLCGKPVSVSRNSSAEAADKLLLRLQALGLEAHIEPQREAAPPAPVAPSVKPDVPEPAGADELFALAAPVATAPVARSASQASNAGSAEVPATPAVADVELVCPKCGEVQPRRTLCRKCGLDMPRYLAAQEAADREAREERSAELEARRGSPGGSRGGAGAQRAGLLGIGFSGRLARLDYFSSALLSSLLWFLLVLLAVATGKMAWVGFGLFLSIIYSLRCIALRLHDTGRTGWLALIALVPILGALMALALLFMGGEEDDNEFGPRPAEGAGRRAILVLVALFVVTGLSFRSISQNPEKSMRFLEAMAAVQGKNAQAAEDEGSAAPQAAARYASNNRVDIYVMAGCSACDEMRAWLNANGLRYTVYSVDSDQQAAERLHSIMAGDGQGQIMLPVLEVNGKVLPGNPDIGSVHRLLRQES